MQLKFSADYINKKPCCFQQGFLFYIINMINNNIFIYTDGACRGNPGPGGWGALLVYANAKKEL